MLEIHDYRVNAQDKEILEGIDFRFETGKTYALMGPNGSGKSTLALSLAGSPSFTTGESSRAVMDRKDLLKLRPEERVRSGLLVTAQSPPSLSGINVFQILRIALGTKMKPLDLRKKLSDTAQKLAIRPELLQRSFNEGFSGGERKKMEILQYLILEPKIAFFDEIDTGVDVDALKTIARCILESKTPDKTFVLITHSTRILEYLRPDTVIVMKDGKIVSTGDADLANEIEKRGYSMFDDAHS